MKDLNWYQSQFDEMFLETMAMLHKNKNIDEAITESYGHLLADELRLNQADQKDCKTLLNSWLSTKRVNGKEKNQIKWKV